MFLESSLPYRECGSSLPMRSSMGDGCIRIHLNSRHLMQQRTWIVRAVRLAQDSVRSWQPLLTDGLQRRAPSGIRTIPSIHMFWARLSLYALYARSLNAPVAQLIGHVSGVPRRALSVDVRSHSHGSALSKCPRGMLRPIAVPGPETEHDCV